MSDGAPKWLISAWEKPCTRRNRALRVSRPIAMEVLEPK